MILLSIFSILPYIILVFGESTPLRMPPTNQLVFSVIACLSYHLLFLHSCRKLGYSFLSVTCFFFWIFMGMAPLMCSLTGRWLWGDITFEMSDGIIKASLLCFLFIGLFHLSHSVAYKRGLLSRYLTTGGAVSDGRLFLGLCLSLAVSIAVLIGLGVDGTFFRSGYDSYVTTGISALFIQNFVRPMPLLIGVPMLWVVLKERLALAQPRTWLAFLTVGLALTINFPFSVARFYGWTVVSIFFYYFYLERKFSRSHWIAGLFLMIGFFGSFVVDAARYAKTVTDIKQSYTEAQAVTTDSFYVGHVDAFEMLVYGTETVQQKGPAMGHQLMGVLLFWVPRDYWPDKPLPTGVLMGTSFINVMMQTENTNLSAPIVLEGYIDFGTTGVVLFALLAGFLGGTLDRGLVERRALQLSGGQLIFGIDAIAAPLLGLWVYLLRGSLLSAFAYSLGIVTASVLVWRYFFRRVR